MGKYDALTEEDILMAFRAAGSKKACARLLHIPWSSFRELWKKKIVSKKLIHDGEPHKIGVMSDLHYGSNYSLPEKIDEFVEHCVGVGCESILIGGDLSDGLNMRKDHQFEVFLNSADDIIEYIASTLPETGIPYYFICGNHDYSLQKVCGLDLGFALAKERSDLHYMGYTKSDIMLPGNVKVRLYHGAGNCGVNRSMRLQKKAVSAIEECINSKTAIPSMFLAGHCHHSVILYNYYNTFCASLGCFQASTPYLEERGLIPDISGLIIEYKSDGVEMLGTPKVEYCKYDVV